MKKLSGIRSRWLKNHMSIMVLVILAAAAALSLTVAGLYYSFLQSGLEAKLENTTDFFESYVTSSPEEFYAAVHTFTSEFEDKNTLELEFIGTDGAIISSSFGLSAGTKPQTSDVKDALSTLEISPFRGRDPQTGEHVLAVTGPVIYAGGEVAGFLRLVTSLRLADQRILQMILIVCCASVFMLLLIAFTGAYFIRSIVTPVVEMTDTAKRIAAGGYGVQIQKKFAENNDEIGELARTVNNLSLQISQTEKMQSEFLSSVSHELRTPLTAISGWGETLLGSEQIDPAMTRRGIVTILKETKRLTSLVEELLEFSRIQDGRFKLTMEETDLRAVFEDTIFMYGNRLSQDGIDLEYEETDEDIPEINCDGERMKQVFLNILDNAAKYGGSGGKILCSIHKTADSVCVYIRDYGPGIPEDELPLVKKKFYKGSASGRGSGIGLAVCEEIVSMHGGELVIANAQEGTGCAVTIRLPL